MIMISMHSDDISYVRDSITGQQDDTMDSIQIHM